MAVLIAMTSQLYIDNHEGTAVPRESAARLAHWFFFLTVLFCFTVSAGAQAGI